MIIVLQNRGLFFSSLLTRKLSLKNRTKILLKTEDLPTYVPTIVVIVSFVLFSIANAGRSFLGRESVQISIDKVGIDSL